MSETLDNDFLIKCYQHGLTDSTIALRAGCCERTVSNRRRSLGLPSLFRNHIRQSKTPNSIECIKTLETQSIDSGGNVMNETLKNDTLIECYRQGMTDHAIALQVGCPVRTVTSRRRSLGLPSLYRKHVPSRKTPERLDLQYANELERYYDQKSECEHEEHERRTAMIRQAKLSLGSKYNATRELKRMFGPEKV